MLIPWFGTSVLASCSTHENVVAFTQFGPDEAPDVADRYQNIRRELKSMTPIGPKPEIIVLTKQDLVDEEELEIVVDLLRDAVGTKESFVVRRLLEPTSIA